MESTNITVEDLKEKYIESMTEKTKHAYLIAKGLLGTSFTLEKSNGYLMWLKEQTEINLCSGIGCPGATNQDRDMPHSGLEPRIEVK